MLLLQEPCCLGSVDKLPKLEALPCVENKMVSIDVPTPANKALIPFPAGVFSAEAAVKSPKSTALPIPA